MNLLERKLSYKEKKSFKPSQYGIPELKKYPLIDKKHVRSAISYFHKADPKYKKELCKRIIAAAKKHGIKISPDSEFAQYAKKNGISLKGVLKEELNLTSSLNELETRIRRIGETVLVRGTNKKEKVEITETSTKPPQPIERIINIMESELSYILLEEEQELFEDAMHGDPQEDYIFGVDRAKLIKTPEDLKDIDPDLKSLDVRQAFKNILSNAYVKIAKTVSNDFDESDPTNKHLIDMVNDRNIYTSHEVNIDKDKGYDPMIRRKVVDILGHEIEEH